MQVVLADEGEAPPGALDRLVAEWRRSPRRWGHPLHRLCSYFAMFPPQVPRVFIEWLTQPGEVVYDPFCGRGTAPMEACRLGRIGLGSDANPLAQALTAAKVDPPTLQAASDRLRQLRKGSPSRKRVSAPREIEMLYTPRVLRQLGWLRERLDPEGQADRFLLATVLGLLHANLEPGAPPRGLSISMPNTFSMAPAYVRRYIDEHQLKPPDVDVFDMVAQKMGRMALPAQSAARGKAWMADARRPGPLGTAPARLIFTSPPYLKVIQYGKYNWIRLWMLGQEPREVDSRLVATASCRRYLDFMGDVLRGLREHLHPEGFLCLVVGDVRSRSSGETVNLAETVWKNAAEPAGWRRLGSIDDRLPQQHKVSRIWGANRKGQATQTDRILVLAPPGSEHGLPPLPDAFDWGPASAWAESPSNPTEDGDASR